MTTKAEQERTMTDRQLEAHRQANRRYHLTDKGHETDRRRRQRRIFCGASYFGMVASPAGARMFNAAIKEKRMEFMQRQMGERKVWAMSASSLGDHKCAPESGLISSLRAR